MNLPIDARCRPFKPKYIQDETSMFNKWMIFGTDQSDQTLHVTDATDDIVIGLTLAQADRLVQVRSTFVNAVLAILNEEPT